MIAYVIVNKTYDGDTEVIEVCLDKKHAEDVCASKNKALGPLKAYEGFEIVESTLHSQ